MSLAAISITAMPAGRHVQIVPVWMRPTDVSDDGWHTTAVSPAGGQLPDRTASISPSHVFVMSALTLRTRRHPTQRGHTNPGATRGGIRAERSLEDRYLPAARGRRPLRTVTLHSTTNPRQTPGIPVGLSLRKLVMVRKVRSEAPSRHISSKLPCNSRSRRRLDWIRFRLQTLGAIFSVELRSCPLAITE